MVKERYFTYLDHPSDVAIEVEGVSLEKLFVNAAKAMLSVISEKSRAKKGEIVSEKRIHLEEESAEELLHAFLSEILWFIGQEGFFPLVIDVVTIDEKAIDMVLKGVSLPQDRMKAEIKAITYHQLEIKKKGGKLFTRIIFDV
jgi:SHS2 domain-containing protein